MDSQSGSSSLKIDYPGEGFRWIGALDAFCERVGGEPLLVPKRFQRMQIVERGTEQWSFRSTAHFAATLLYVAENDWANWLESMYAQHLAPYFSENHVMEQMTAFVHPLSLMDQTLLRNSETDAPIYAMIINALDRFMVAIPNQAAMIGHEEERLYTAVTKSLEHLDTKITAASISTITGLNVSRVQSLFQVLFGESVQGFYLRIRMEKAKYILLNETISVSAVAMLLGFSSASYFSKLFKEYAGISAGTYRKMATDVRESGMREE